MQALLVGLNVCFYLTLIFWFISIQVKLPLLCTKMLAILTKLWINIFSHFLISFELRKGYKVCLDGENHLSKLISWTIAHFLCCPTWQILYFLQMTSVRSWTITLKSWKL